MVVMSSLNIIYVLNLLVYFLLLLQINLLLLQQFQNHFFIMIYLIYNHQIIIIQML